jgi:hypothetical protein
VSPPFVSTPWTGYRAWHRWSAKSAVTPRVKLIRADAANASGDGLRRLGPVRLRTACFVYAPPGQLTIARSRADWSALHMLPPSRPTSRADRDRARWRSCLLFLPPRFCGTEGPHANGTRTRNPGRNGTPPGPDRSRPRVSRGHLYRGRKPATGAGRAVASGLRLLHHLAAICNLTRPNSWGVEHEGLPQQVQRAAGGGGAGVLRARIACRAPG